MYESIILPERVPVMPLPGAGYSVPYRAMELLGPYGSEAFV